MMTRKSTATGTPSSSWLPVALVAAPMLIACSSKANQAAPECERTYQVALNMREGHRAADDTGFSMSMEKEQFVRECHAILSASLGTCSNLSSLDGRRRNCEEVIGKAVRGRYTFDVCVRTAPSAARRDFCRAMTREYDEQLLNLKQRFAQGVAATESRDADQQAASNGTPYGVWALVSFEEIGVMGTKLGSITEEASKNPNLFNDKEWIRQSRGVASTSVEAALARDKSCWAKSPPDGAAPLHDKLCRSWGLMIEAAAALDAGLRDLNPKELAVVGQKARAVTGLVNSLSDEDYAVLRQRAPEPSK